MPKVEETKIATPRSLGGSTYIPSKWSMANLASAMNVRISDAFDGDFSGPDIDENNYNPLEQAMDAWNDAHDDLTFFTLPAQSTSNISSSSLANYNDSTLGIYKSYNWFSNVSNEAIAITSFYGFLRNKGSSNEYLDLTHADIIVNYDHYSFSTNPTSAEFDIQTVILHELGHFIGLKHPSDYWVPAVMQSTLAPGDEKRNLYAYDRSALNSNYFGYNENLTHFQAATNSLRHSNEDDEMISGYYELRKDGRCLHFQNGKFIQAHKH